MFVLSYGRHNLFWDKTYGEHRLRLNSLKRKKKKSITERKQKKEVPTLKFNDKKKKLGAFCSFTFDYHYSFCSISKCSLFKSHVPVNFLSTHNLITYLCSHKVPLPTIYHLVYLVPIVHAHPRFSHSTTTFINWRNLLCYNY